MSSAAGAAEAAAAAVPPPPAADEAAAATGVPPPTINIPYAKSGTLEIMSQWNIHCETFKIASKLELFSH